MDSPIFDHGELGNVSGLQARLDRDSIQCPLGYFRLIEILTLSQPTGHSCKNF